MSLGDSESGPTASTTTNAELTGLAQHLETVYGISVSGLTPLEPWAPQGVQRVDRADGPSWVARISPPRRPFEAAVGDAEILRYLQTRGYPAERCAHDNPVSVFDGRAVVVTNFLPGSNARHDTSAQMVRRVGQLVGWLHSLPLQPGAVSRPAGGWHHVSIAGGGRRADVEALLPAMDIAAKRLKGQQLDLYKELLAELDAVDGCEDLPHALINCDLGGPNVIVGTDGSASVVDWTGSGRGPRVHSLVGMFNAKLSSVDEFVIGYRQHAELEQDELDRLPDALTVHSLILDCWSFAYRGTQLDTILPGRAAIREHAKRVADRARTAFA